MTGDMAIWWYGGFGGLGGLGGLVWDVVPGLRLNHHNHQNHLNNQHLTNAFRDILYKYYIIEMAGLTGCRDCGDILIKENITYVYFRKDGTKEAT